MRIPFILLVLLWVGTFLIDWYLWTDVKKATNKRGWRIAFIVGTALCWLFLIVTLSLPRREEGADILPVMWMLYTYLSIYLAKLGYVVCSLVGRLMGKIVKHRNIRKVSRAVGVLMGFLLLAVMWEGVFYSRYNIEVVNVEVESHSIPRQFNGYKIAQISDLHVGTWGNDTTFISSLVDSVNSLHPDLIVFTGDIVNRETKEIEPFLPVLARLQAPDGVMSILGNHDYGDYMDWHSPAAREENNRQLAVHQKNIGWDLLNNERRFVSRNNDSIMIIGVENIGDPPFPSYGDLNQALPATSDSLYHQNDRNYKILLTHNPAHWDEYVSHNTNIHLTLSGHTHAMQMVLRIGNWTWSPAIFRYPLWGGMYERYNDKGADTRLYVNIGAGEVGMPSRLLAAYPEITLFTLNHKAH